MAKTIEFEDEDRIDISNEPMTSKEAAKKKILITEPHTTSIKLGSLEGVLQNAEITIIKGQNDKDRVTAQIAEIKAALNIVG